MNDMYKKVGLIFIILMVSVLTIACEKKESSSNAINTINEYSQSESFVEDEFAYEIKENLDENTPLLYSGPIFGCFTQAPPSTSKELFDEANLIVLGTVIETKVLVSKENESEKTNVTLSVEKIYKGDLDTKTIGLSFMGGVLSGEKYIETHPKHIQKGIALSNGTVTIEEIKNHYQNKNVDLPSFEGELIPELGKQYLIFAHTLPEEAPKDLPFNHYIAGYEYAQGVFEVRENGKINDFRPDIKEKISNEIKEKATKIFKEAESKGLKSAEVDYSQIKKEIKERYKTEIPEIVLETFIKKNL